MPKNNNTGARDILETFTEGFPLLAKIYEIYEQSPTISKDNENSLRRSTEWTTLEILELIVTASRQSREPKIVTLKLALDKIDTLKVFVDLAFQTGQIKEKGKLDIQASISNVELMIKNWRKALTTK